MPGDGRKKLKKIFICYAVLADGLLAYGNAIMMMDAVTQENLDFTVEEIAKGIREQKPEIMFESLVITFIRELEG